MFNGDNTETFIFRHLYFDISIEYDIIFDERHATTTCKLYGVAESIPYTKWTSIHYRTRPKKGTIRTVKINKLFVHLLQGLLLLILEKRDNFAKNKK